MYGPRGGERARGPRRCTGEGAEGGITLPSSGLSMEAMEGIEGIVNLNLEIPVMIVNGIAVMKQ